MLIYILRRILLLIPTFLGITLLTFLLINMAPGSPLDQKLTAARFGKSGRTTVVSQEVVDSLKRQYGFDKPVHIRYWIWLKNIASLDFGTSFTYEEPVIDVISSKFPVSLQFGVASLILTYLICIPLGVGKAIRAGGVLDKVSGFILYFAYSVPSLVLALFLIVFFAGSSHFSWFPIGGLKSDNYETFSFLGKFADRIHHFVLPIICYMLSGFTELTMVTRNSMLDVIKADYIRTARAKGVRERVVIFKHALRNAMIPVATGLGGFFSVFLAGSLIIETIFNLDGIGLLGYKSALNRDYNVVMGLTFMMALVSLLGRLVGDIVYVIIDPRIDFN